MSSHKNHTMERGIGSTCTAATAIRSSNSSNSVYVIDFSTVSTSPLTVNPLGQSLRTYIWKELQVAAAASHVQSIVLTGGGRNNFSAGADLTEFSSLLSSLKGGDTNGSSNINSFIPTLIDVVDAIEGCPKPVVACIAGACLGGGLEVALACHYRVALLDKSTKLGLPEVHVGVIPGAGGTQRLPRIIGLQQALQMILTGAPVNAQKAFQLKLVDAIVVENNDNATQLLETAIKWATWAQVMPLDHRRVGTGRTITESPPVAHALCHVASLSLPKHGSDGLHAALTALRASYTAPSFRDGMRKEGELFAKVLQSSQGQARRHGFFAVRTAQKAMVTNSSSDSTSGNVTKHILLQRDISTVVTAVIGAGTMGVGIAYVLLSTGFAVKLVDVSQAALSKGVAMIRGMIKSAQTKKKLSPQAAHDMQQRLSFTQSLHDLGNCALVVEAVVEQMTVKQSIFGTLARVTRHDCLLLSNTSTLDIDKMASILQSSEQRRQYFAGWHFFSPAHVMKLVEIVRGQDTSMETILLLQALTKRIGKIGVVVGNCDGFCGNRMLRPYSAETVLLLVEDGGLSIQQVDNAFVEFGMAIGPFQMSDLAGNDIGFNIRRARQWVREGTTSLQSPPNRPARYTELADDMVSQLGRLGQKVGKGWYDYDATIGKGRKPLVSVEMTQFIQRYITTSSSSSQHCHSHPLSNAQIIERVLYPLVNEGFKCLEEGICRCPSDIDVVYLYGYGWPMWRGGPMYWADHDVTLPVLLDTLQKLYVKYPTTEHYQPSRLLQECVALGLTVDEYYRQGQHETAAANRRRHSKL